MKILTALNNNLKTLLFVLLGLFTIFQLNAQTSDTLYWGDGPWVCPAGVATATVEIWGAGGGGGGTPNTNKSGAGGGGGGAYVRVTAYAVSAGNYTVTIGGGGNGGGASSNGSAGGSTTFDGSITANGGSGGGAAPSGAGGAGGTASGGNANYDGGDGAAGQDNSHAGGGGGGAGTSAAGGNANQDVGGSGGSTGGGAGADGGNAAGVAGSVYGGGGAGGYGKSKPGGPGADGWMIITYTISVSADPTITLGAFPSECQGVTSANLPYSATTDNPDEYSIVWTGAANGLFTPVTLATLDPTPIVIAVPGSAPVALYTGNLTVKNSSTGKTSIVYGITVDVTALTVPSVSIGAASNPICDGDNVLFTATPTNPGSSPSYQWKVNGGNVGLDQVTYSTTSLNDGDAVTCFITNTDVCANNTPVVSNSINMTVVDPPSHPSAGEAGVDKNIVVTTVDMTATPLTTGTGTWSKISGPGTPTIVSPNSPTSTINGLSTGVYVYRWTGSNSPCADKTDDVQITVTVPLNPTITLSNTNSSDCQGQTPANFAYSATTDGADRYKIDFNAAAITAGFVNVPYTVLAGAPSSFNVTVPSATPAVYNGTLTVKNNGTGDVGVPTYAITITITGLISPSISIGAASNPICDGDNVLFTATPTDGGSSPAYVWRINGGSSVGTNVTYNNLGTLNDGDQVTCDITNTDVCGDPGTVTSNTINMTVVAPPSHPSAGQAGVDKNIAVTSVAMTATPLTIGTGTWSKISGPGTPTIVSPNSPTSTINGLSNGVYVYRWTGSNSPCADKTDDVQITVALPVSPTITLSNTNSSDCQGQTSANFAYSATTSTPDQYSIAWSGAALAQGFINVNLATLDPTPIVAVVPGTAVANTYSGDLTVKNSGTGLTSGIYPITVEVIAVPIASVSIVLTSAVPTNCSGSMLTYTATPTNGGGSPTYQWKVNGGNVGSNQNTFASNSLNNGDNVTCELTSDATCVSPTPVTSNSVAVAFATTAQPSATSGPLNVSGSTAGYIYSIGAVAGAVDYTWTPPVGAGWSVTAGGGTNTSNLSITLTSGTASDVLSVVANNACGASVAEEWNISITLPHDACTGCHLWHNALGSNLTGSSGNANLCMSCHTSGVPIDKQLADADKAIPGTSGTSHRWNMEATNATFETNTPLDPGMVLRMSGDSIFCSTCHNQHTGQAPSFLRMDNTGDAMCKGCHSARDVGTYATDNVNHRGSHPVGTVYPTADPTRFNATPTNPLTLIVGDSVQCLSCHSMHNAPNSDGYLTTTTNDNNLCTSCHVYEPHMGQDCNMCHKLHNPDKDNILMVNDTILGNPVVFTSQGAGAYTNATLNDGVCEVCHQNTIYYQDDGSGAAHQAGSDCKTCHNHEDNFKPKCISCHNTAQAGNVPRDQISGSGGQFDSTSFHANLQANPKNRECRNCHYTSDHGQSPWTVNLNNMTDDTKWTGTRNDWCLLCHTSSPPPGISFPGGDSKYDKTSITSTPHYTSGKMADDACGTCHQPHGSSVQNLVRGTSVFDACATCHAGSGIATYKIEQADMADPGVGGNYHAWGAPANQPAYGASDPLDPAMLAALDASGNITCGTCHDPHDNTFSPYLRVTMAGDALCKDCHAARNVGRYADDNVNNRGSHPVGVTYPVADPRFNLVASLDPALILQSGKVECTTCHSVHQSTETGGYLLNMPNNVAFCTECHTYPDHLGEDCLSCHNVHADASNTNINLVRNSIVTPNSGTRNAYITASTASIQGSSPFEGVCETCHTTNSYNRHYNSNPGDHTHNATSRCLDCHAHQTGMPGAPETSCIICHAFEQGPRTIIVGPGPPIGEFDLGGSRHTLAAVQDKDCKLCHADLDMPTEDHSNGTITLVDPDDTTTVWTGNINTFCVACHDGGAPFGVNFVTAPIAKYDKSNFAATKHQTDGNMGTASCRLCHNRHGSVYENTLTVGPSNYIHCNSCHKSGGLAATMPIDSATFAFPGTSGNNHAFNVPAVNGTYETRSPTITAMSDRLEGANIVCSTCHNPHDNTNTPLLRSSNTGDAICKDCHFDRDVGTYIATSGKGSHPVGISIPGTAFYNNPGAATSTTVGTVSGLVECSSCHDVHNATTADGMLLRQTNETALCRDCHTMGVAEGTPLGTHNGMTCLVCHTVHNTDKGNIYMIRDTIETPNSGSKWVEHTGVGTLADGDGTYNGICEVCHTTALHHRNDGSDATAHNDGLNCITCHPHDGNFGKRNCAECHNQTQGSIPRRIITTEFTNPGNSHHLQNTLDVADCEVCHIQTNHMTGTIFLNDPDGGGDHTYTPGSPNSVDAFCKGCHDADGATAFGGLTPFTDGVTVPNCTAYTQHNGNGCNYCHSAHGSTNLSMINDTVLTPTKKAVVFTSLTLTNSYADGDATYDGICEVCHTSTKHHTNTDDGGQNHKDGTNCTTCHGHADEFAPVACTDCHSSAQGSQPIINSTGGQFDSITNHAAGADATFTECEACHYTVDGTASHMNNGTTPILKDPDAAAAWSGDKDDYCMACHDGSPAVDKKTTYFGNLHDTYATNSCALCHNKHGSSYTALLTESTNYLVCNSCHNVPINSTGAINSGDIATPGGSGTTHAWDISASSGLYETNTPTGTAPGPAMTARLSGGDIVCSTCHDPHTNTSKFLVASNAGDAMCKDCHSARNVLRYQDGASNKGSHPVGIAFPVVDTNYDVGHTLALIGGNVECSTCHSIHNATSTGGNLLNMTNNVNLCKDCHTLAYNAGSPLGTHNNMTCIDCHAVHSTDKGNIYMIRDSINTPSSGMKQVVHTSSATLADGDGTYNGICEVCHTTTSYHTNTDDGTTHNDGLDCIGCHAHETNFTPSGDCLDCHNQIQGPRRIVTTEFAKNSTHLSGTLDAGDCVVCHDQGSHQAGTVILKDADGGSSVNYNAGTPNTMDVICKSCHDANGASGDNTPFTSGATVPNCTTYDQHNGRGCHYCHSAHGSDNLHMINDTVLTPTKKPVLFTAYTGTNSYADGNGTYDGICEVCHTGTTYHTNTNDGTTHNDALNCTTSCHGHAEEFAPPSCHGCHITDVPNYPAAPDYTEGAHGKHINPPYSFTCSECHFGLDNTSPGHATGTVDIIFDPTGVNSRFGLDLGYGDGAYNSGDPYWDPVGKTCRNIYCHSNGRSAHRGSTNGLGSDPSDLTWSPVIGADYAGADNAQAWVTTPPWTGSLNYTAGLTTGCGSCHPAVGDPIYGNFTDPYTVNSTSQNAPGDCGNPKSGGHQTGAHINSANGGVWYDNDLDPGSSKSKLSIAYDQPQCFYCHQANPGYPTDDDDMLMGTYGTEYHVDGKTWFSPFNYDVNNPTTNPIGTTSQGDLQGTMSPKLARDHGEHCSSGQSCF